MSEFQYQGDELSIFSKAVRWKSYWSKNLRRHVKGDVLDVGAGQGNNLEFLLDGTVKTWTALEPDGELLKKSSIQGEIARDSRIRWVTGTTDDLLTNEPGTRYDSLIYIDVMEHIEDDQGEFERAARLLKPGGHLVILSPAFQFLYSPFDKAIGHFRRYQRPTLSRLNAPGMTLEKMFFLDAAGFLLSAANRVMLRQSMPTQKQINFWDRWIIPISRVVDPLVFRSFGRSIIGVWRRGDAAGGAPTT